MAEPKYNQQKIGRLATQSSRVLFDTKTVFPFTFLPDSIIVDEAKVTIIRWDALLLKSVFPILIEDIKNVVLTTSLFFGSLTFEIGGYETNPPPINYLKKSAAIRARQIITGLITAKREGVDLSSIPRQETIKKMKQIGYAHESF